MYNTVGDIAKMVEELAPIELACSWDNVGLLVGSMRARVTRLMLALDADLNTMQEAVDNGCEMLVVHHPILFSAVKRITDDEPSGAKLLFAIQNGLNVYSAHTNLDSAVGGIDDVLAKLLGISSVTPLVPSQIDARAGIGRIGVLEQKMSLNEFGLHIRKKLDVEHISVSGDLGMSISKIAIVCGSGMEYACDAAKRGADLFITGDIKYHSVQQARELGLACMDITHYDSEKIILPVLRDYINSRYPELAVVSEHDGQLLKNIREVGNA